MIRRFRQRFIRHEATHRKAGGVVDLERAVRGAVADRLASLKITRLRSFAAVGVARRKKLRTELQDNLRAIAKCMASGGEDFAVDAVLPNEVRFDVELRATHPIDHLDGIRKRARRVVATMNGDDPCPRADRLHRREVIRIAEEPQLLVIERQKIRTRRIAAEASVQIAATRQLERDVVRQLFHAAQVDHTRERAWCKLVTHQRHVAPTGAAGREDSAGRELHSPALQSVVEPPQRSHRIESLQVAEVIRLRTFDRILRAALQIVDAQCDDVEFLGQHGRTGRAHAIGAAPVVQRQHQTGSLADVGQLATRKMHEHSHPSRPRPQRPLLSRNLDRSVLLRQRRPIVGNHRMSQQQSTQNNEPSENHTPLPHNIMAMPSRWVAV